MSYALIKGGVVIDVSDAEFPVNSAFSWEAVPSGETVRPGYTFAAGVFTAPPAAAAPTIAEQAREALSAGLTISSAGTPTLDGKYAVDDAAQGRINRVQSFIAQNGKFPGGGPSLPWPDMSGNLHEFSATAEFTAFATAVAEYVFALDAVIMGATTTLPPPTATIP